MTGQGLGPTRLTKGGKSPPVAAFTHGKNRVRVGVGAGELRVGLGEGRGCPGKLLPRLTTDPPRHMLQSFARRHYQGSHENDYAESH
jgi:hypothetical protein